MALYYPWSYWSLRFGVTSHEEGTVNLSTLFSKWTEDFHFFGARLDWIDTYVVDICRSELIDYNSRQAMLGMVGLFLMNLYFTLQLDINMPDAKHPNQMACTNVLP